MHRTFPSSTTAPIVNIEYTSPTTCRTRPLVIALHGYSGNSNEMINSYGWIESWPTSEVSSSPVPTVPRTSSTIDSGMSTTTSISSSTSTTTAFCQHAAVHLQGLHGLDPERTFVTGFSNGAEMCFQLACRARDVPCLRADRGHDAGSALQFVRSRHQETHSLAEWNG